MAYTGWNSISVQFAIENMDKFDFNLFNRNDLVLFSSIMFEEFKKYRSFIKNNCTYQELYDFNSTYILCPYCGTKMNEYEYNNYKCCSQCQSN